MAGIIRVWGGYPEGVSFSILFMNAFTPLLDRMISIKKIKQIRYRKILEKSDDQETSS